MDSSKRRDIANVSIGIVAEELDPSQVTSILGFQPTKSYRKGEVSPGKRVPRPYGVWDWEAQGDDVQEAALVLLKRVRPVKHLLAEAVARYSATVNVAVWWEPSAAQGGFSLNSDTLKELSELCERMDFYFVSVE